MSRMKVNKHYINKILLLIAIFLTIIFLSCTKLFASQRVNNHSRQSSFNTRARNVRNITRNVRVSISRHTTSNTRVTNTSRTMTIRRTTISSSHIPSFTRPMNSLVNVVYVVNRTHNIPIGAPRPTIKFDKNINVNLIKGRDIYKIGVLLPGTNYYKVSGIPVFNARLNRFEIPCTFATVASVFVMPNIRPQFLSYIGY